jgi:hypothetical protein
MLEQFEQLNIRDEWRGKKAARLTLTAILFSMFELF